MTDDTAFRTSVRTGLIEYGKESTKIMAALNGGATIAILALVGQFAKNPAKMQALAGKLSPFLFGLVAAAISTLATYLSFFAIDANWSSRVRQLTTIFAWSSAAASLILFVVGCWQIQNTLLNLP